MKIWLVKYLSEESILDDIDSAINNALISANLRTYLGNSSRFAEKKYHPTNDLVALPINIDKVLEWKEHILIHVDVNELVELTDDWNFNRTE